MNTVQQHPSDIRSPIAHLGLDEYSLLDFTATGGWVAAHRMAAGNPAVRALVTIGAQMSQMET